MTEYRKYPGSCYSITFNSTSISSGASLFPFQAGANTRVAVEEIFVGAVSSNPSAAIITLYRGSTTPVSTAVLATLVNMDGWQNSSTAGSICGTPSTSSPSTTSAVIVDIRNLEDGFHYHWTDNLDLLLVPSQRLDVVITGISAVSFVGTMRIREVGKNPIS